LIGPGQGSLPVFGGTLLVYPVQAYLPVVLSGSPGAPGDGSFSFSGVATISGMSVFFQTFLVDPNAVKGVSMSNGLEIAFP
jgi:hypothetical protein